MGWLFRVSVARRTWVAVANAVIGIALFSLSKPEHPAQSGSALEPDNTISAVAGLRPAAVRLGSEGLYSVIGKKPHGRHGAEASPR